MKNKFTKKHKNVLIINGTQGMAQLSLAVISTLNNVKLAKQKCLSSSTPRARKLSCSSTFLNADNTSNVLQGSVPRARKLSLVGSLITTLAVVASALVPLLGFSSHTATAAPADTLNFQGRLLASDGSLVPDGDYHVEFKLYNASAVDGGETLIQGACTTNPGAIADEDCLWTETRSTGNLVTIQNGYYSVYLGEVTSLPVIDWSQELYLGMNIGGTGTVSWDGEMTPRFKLTAVPFAFRAANVASSSVDSADSDDVTIQSGDTTTSGTSGDIVVDTGSGFTSNGGITLGAANASALTIGNASATTTLQGAVVLTGTGTALDVQNNVTLGSDGTDTLTVNADATFTDGLTVQTGDTLSNAGSTLFNAAAIGDTASGDIGTAGATVDIATTFDISQTTASQTLTLPDPTTTASGRIAFVNNVGSTSFEMYGSVIGTGESNAFIWNGTSWVTTVSLSGSVVDTVGTIDTQTKSADGAVISAGALYLQTADIDDVGLVSIGAQTLKRRKDV